MKMRMILVSSPAIFYLVLSLCVASAFCQDSNDPVDYINPFLGTDFYSHTFPGACLPFGMVQLNPDVNYERWGYASLGYHYAGNSIIGFTHINFSGSGGRGRPGEILFMPRVGQELKIIPGSRKNPGEGYRSRFSHDEEEASAGYYAVNLKDYNIQVELTSTRRVGFHKYTFPKSNDAYIIIDLGYGRGRPSEREIARISEEAKYRRIPERVLLAERDIRAHIKFIDRTKVEGYRDSYGSTVYFAAEFSKPFFSYGTWDSRRTVYPTKTEESGGSIGGYVKYNTTEKEEILVKVGISFVSTEGAWKNLNAEIPHWNFIKVRENARNTWNNELSKIMIKGGTNDQKVTFYTALYHALLAQYISNDVDGTYLGMDGKVYTAENYDFYPSFLAWDTFRTEHPLLTLIEAEHVPDIVKSIIDKYKHYGWLPAQHTRNRFSQGMVGDHLVPIIVDAYMKGIRDYDVETAYEAMRKKALELPSPPLSPEIARHGLEYYKSLGFIPADRVTESVSKTLEYCYNDWCIAQMAKALGKQDDYELFIKRARYYENLFDSTTRFMRPRKEDGSWLTMCEGLPNITLGEGYSYYSCFDPLFVGSRPNRHFTESNAWQYLWFVPHDARGLINLLGGNENFVSKLDTFFTMTPEVTGPKYVGVAGTIGQYVHANQPSHHVGYLYNYAGQPWKTQKIVRHVMDDKYGPGPDGLCGNEDMGSLSSWYVLSAIGCYPVCPGQNVYVFGTPLFEETRINLGDYYGNGKFVIKAEGVSFKNIYIQSAALNGESYNKTWIDHKDIVNGGELIFKMGPEPNKEWGSSPENAPPSMAQ